jgi:hypothetical protein
MRDFGEAAQVARNHAGPDGNGGGTDQQVWRSNLPRSASINTLASINVAMEI